MEEAVWICEEPEAEVSFYGQSLEAIRSSGYAPYQPGPTSFSHFIYYLFISFNPKKKKYIRNVQLKAYRNRNIRHIRVLQFCPVPFNPSISVRDGIFTQFHLICLFPLRPQRLWSRDGVRFQPHTMGRDKDGFRLLRLSLSRPHPALLRVIIVNF